MSDSRGTTTGRIDEVRSQTGNGKIMEKREEAEERNGERNVGDANGRLIPSQQAESKRMENGANGSEDFSRTRDGTLGNTKEQIGSGDELLAARQHSENSCPRVPASASINEFFEGTKIPDGTVVMHELKDDDEMLTLDLSDPTPDVMEYAKLTLGESDEVKCQTLQELRDTIYERGECLPHRMDDDFLIRFLRARDFNVRRAHRLVANYYNFKEEHPEIHKNVNPLELNHIGEDDVMSVPAYRTQCGRRMMIYRLGNWNPRNYPVYELFKATVIILELGVLEPRAQILGGVAIFDLEGISIAHAWTITPQIATMVMALMVSAFPMKTHAIHILNQSWVFDAIFKVFKPLLDSRMQDKIYFHGSDLESLHKHISPLHLPKKYGGTQEELNYYKWIDSLSKAPKIVKEMKSLGYVIPDTLQTISD